MKRVFLMFFAALCLTAAASLTTRAQACSFTTSAKSKTMTLNADCTTDHSVVVPNGYTLDGAGHTVTAVDPSGGHFVGGVVQNGGAAANVTNLKITTSHLIDVCDGGADRLRGILFDGASGSITGNDISNINQGASGCQEGNAIEVRNFDGVALLAAARALVDVGNIVAGDRAGRAVEEDAAQTVCAAVADINQVARGNFQVGHVGRRPAVLDDAADEVAARRVNRRDGVARAVERVTVRDDDAVVGRAVGVERHGLGLGGGGERAGLCPGRQRRGGCQTERREEH